MELTLPPHNLSQSLAQAVTRMVSWRLEVNLPAAPKYVLVGAPHTSNWDLFYGLLVKYGAGVDFNFVGKDSLFRWPVDGMLRRLGGIPVNRRSRNNFVDQMVAAFDRMERLILVITPEGTRSRTQYWKTGFYYIALGANVPVALGFIDYGRKVIGIDPGFMPTGDIQADFRRIQEFYAGIQGKYPEKQGKIEIKP